MSLADWMYNKIPEVTRARDENESLKQLLAVLASGFDFVKADADDIKKLQTIDECPDELLPYLGAMYGFDFPFDLTANKQRNFLRSIVPLTTTKGTPWSLRLAALRIIGDGFDLSVTDEDYQAKTFNVQIEAEGTGDTSQLEQKLDFMVKEYAPAGLVHTITVIYYFGEIYDSDGFTDENPQAFEFSSWRTNIAHHKINHNIEPSEQAESEVPGI